MLLTSLQLNLPGPRVEVSWLEIEAATGSGATAAEVWAYVLPNGLTAEQTLVDMLACCERTEKILRNKQITDPAGGTLTIFESDGVTTFMQAALSEDAAGLQPYRGQGAERRERLS